MFSALRHHDLQPYNNTPRTPPWYNLPLSLSETPLELKTRSRRAPKAMVVVAVREVAVEEQAEEFEGLDEADRAPAVQHQV